jgi:tripartite-type tricarboxylate transporter receptor subunit TctC
LWRGIHLPKGTPPEIIARLEKAIQESVLSAEFKKLGETVGYIPAYQNSEAFAKMVAADDVVVAQMMTKAGLRKK